MHRIRAATESDLLQAARIYEEEYRTADWVSSSERNAINFQAATKGEDVFVAVDQQNAEHVRGFISIWTRDCFIHHLFVDRNCRRMGVGTALLNSLACWLPRPWTLKCVEANTAALGFYRSLGWVEKEANVGVHGAYRLLELP